MSQDEALAFTRAFSLLMLIVSGVAQAVVISCRHFHSQTVFLSMLPLQLLARMWVSGAPSISPLHLRLAAKPVILINRRLDFCGETLRLVSQGAARR